MTCRRRLIQVNGGGRFPAVPTALALIPVRVRPAAPGLPCRPVLLAHTQEEAELWPSVLVLPRASAAPKAALDLPQV